MKMLVAVVILLAAGALAQNSKLEIPSEIKPPETEKLLLEAHATGVQIYVCTKTGEDKYAWNLKAPEADLRDDSGRVIIMHSAGPTWQHKDGSRVTGKVESKMNAPDTDDIPWLLLTATSPSNQGVLANVTHIQRIHTHGGQPTGDCKGATAGSEIRSQYSADYLFYTR